MEKHYRFIGMILNFGKTNSRNNLAVKQINKSIL